MKLRMSEKDLKALAARWKEVEHEAGEGKKTPEKMTAAAERSTAVIAGCGWDTDKERESEDALHMAKPEPAHHYVTRGLYSFFL